MKKFFPILLVLLLLSGCGTIDPIGPSPSASSILPSAPPTPTTVSIYVPSDSVEQPQLKIEYAELAELTPQALLDEIVVRSTSLNNLEVIEFTGEENSKTKSLTVAEDFRAVYLADGDLVGRQKLVASICCTFMDAYKLDHLLFTCEGAPFPAGNDTFSGVHAGFEYLGEVVMDTSGCLYPLDGDVLTYDEIEILYSWETDRIKEYENYLSANGEDFSDWYWTVIYKNKEAVQGKVTENTIIRLCRGRNEFEYSTVQELGELLKDNDDPAMFKIKFNEKGEITHLLQYGLGIGSD